MARFFKTAALAAITVDVPRVGAAQNGTITIGQELTMRAGKVWDADMIPVCFIFNSDHTGPSTVDYRARVKRAVRET